MEETLTKYEFDLTDYKCPLCIEISTDPIESNCCHHIFCKLCV